MYKIKQKHTKHTVIYTMIHEEPKEYGRSSKTSYGLYIF